MPVFARSFDGLAVQWIAVGVAALAFPLAAYANINLELRPFSQTVNVGDTVDLGLYAVSDSASNQTMAAANVILNWDTAFVNLMGFHQTGATPLLSSGFPPDPHGLNLSLTDGDAMWIGFAFLGSPVAATPAGTLLTTFQFSALNFTAPSTLVDIVPTDGTPPGNTTVFDGTIPNFNVTGTLSGATITIVPGPFALAVISLGGLVCGRSRRRS